MAVPRPNLLATVSRTVLLTVIVTTLAFALTLLISILSLATLSAIRHTHVDMTVAYRVIGVRVVMVIAPLALVVIGAWQTREYLRARSEARPLKFANH